MPFTVREVEIGLRELAEELANSEDFIKFEVVGGAAVMLQASRTTVTSDIDALFTMRPAIESAIQRVAMRND